MRQPEDFAVLLALLGAFAIVWFGHSQLGRLSSYLQWHRRSLRKAPLRRVADLVEGPIATVSGTARALEDGPLVGARLSGRSCLAYVVVVEQWDRRAIAWKTLATETHGTPFALVDESGSVVVDPVGARTAFDLSDQFSGVFDALTANQRALLDHLGIDPNGGFSPRKLRYREGIVADGDALMVCGQCVTTQDPSARAGDEGYRGGPRTTLQMTSTRAQPLILSTLDRPPPHA